MPKKQTRCTEVCCVRPPPLKDRELYPFPEFMWEFPCRQWRNIYFTWPLKGDWEYDKLAYACREASNRWQNAFEFECIGDLDAVDFTVAVFSMTWQL